MPHLTRRVALAAAASALAAPAIVRAQSLGGGARVTVIGAGAFGAWTAEHLRRSGMKVQLLDAWGPAHSRASSGGESRMTRGAYGRDEVYTRMALDSLAEWKALSARSELPLFHPVGVLFFFAKTEAYVTAWRCTGGWGCRPNCSARRRCGGAFRRSTSPASRQGCSSHNSGH
jgi:sarcosine oxidase